MESLGDYRDRDMDPVESSASSSPPRHKDMCVMSDHPDRSRHWVTPVDSMWGRIIALLSSAQIPGPQKWEIQ